MKFLRIFPQDAFERGQILVWSVPFDMCIQAGRGAFLSAVLVQYFNTRTSQSECRGRVYLPMRLVPVCAFKNTQQIGDWEVSFCFNFYSCVITGHMFAIPYRNLAHETARQQQNGKVV